MEERKKKEKRYDVPQTSGIKGVTPATNIIPISIQENF
jgi:hypothetical protein